MRTTDTVTLQLSASGIDNYCRDLARRSPTLEKRVTTIDALITFISSQAEPGEQVKPEFLALKQTLLSHFEEAREALLDERTVRLQHALLAQHLPPISALYTDLSRDAFWTLLGRVEHRLDAVALEALRCWASHWLEDTKQRARAASPFPDVIDFKAAGIDAADYLAMTDLGRYLGVAT